MSPLTLAAWWILSLLAVAVVAYNAGHHHGADERWRRTHVPVAPSVPSPYQERWR